MSEIQEQDCGCYVTTEEDGTEVYTACLACALIAAGQMLVQAGSRIREGMQAEAEANKQVRDFIGGSD